MNGKIGFRILSALVLIAAIAGIAYFAYNAGVAHGSPVTIQAPAGESAPAPYPPFGYGYGMPFHPPFAFGFGCFGILIPLFLLFLAFNAFRFMLWGPRFGHMHGHGMMHHGPGEHGVPSMFEEWHKRMHGEQPAEDKKE
jgi:hypothetical protein